MSGVEGGVGMIDDTDGAGDPPTESRPSPSPNQLPARSLARAREHGSGRVCVHVHVCVWLGVAAG